MDMDQAAVFLAGSILTMLGFVVVTISVIIINNLIDKYWKDLGWFKFTFHTEPSRFATQDELSGIARASKTHGHGFDSRLTHQFLK